ncbi:hypothetical protein F2P79_003163 [Pimephales promelas]|nr:hypothetical protein F2P79_003163 [Pimephales promelas]
MGGDGGGGWPVFGFTSSHVTAMAAYTTTRRNEIPLQNQQNSSPAEKKNNIRGEKLKRLWVQLPPTNTAVGGVNRCFSLVWCCSCDCLTRFKTEKSSSRSPCWTDSL